MVQSLKLGPTLYLQEYNITNGIEKILQRIREDKEVTIITEGTNFWLPAFHILIYIYIYIIKQK